MSMETKLLAPFPGRYDNCVDFQHFSKELVVYSPLVEQFVTIAWCDFSLISHWHLDLIFV